MLVAKRGDNLATFPICRGSFIEEPTARKHHLFGLRDTRVGAMLTNEQHPTHSQRVRPQGQCFGDGFRHPKPVLLREPHAEIIVGELIHIERHKLQVGPRATILLPALQQLPDNHIGMRPMSVDGDHCSHRQRGFARLIRGHYPCQSGIPQRETRRGDRCFDEPAARDRKVHVRVHGASRSDAIVKASVRRKPDGC